MSRTKLVLSSILATGVLLAGCMDYKMSRWETAKRLTGPTFMVDRELQAGEFVLTLFERIHKRGGSAHVYIEGDDVETGSNPTPKNPIGLHMATRDKSSNVIYIARPCQYSKTYNKFKETPMEDKTCDVKYSKTHRFAPEVIASYNAALDELKKRWGIRSFDLYGHSGGGAIAALLAADRDDITSLTTVAGNLDHKAYSNSLIRRKTNSKYVFEPLEGSLNPVDVAYKTKDIPQYHYIGGSDDVMPPAALYSYLSAIGPTNCVYYDIIQENNYTDGWVDKWPELLKEKPVCRGIEAPVDTIEIQPQTIEMPEAPIKLEAGG